MTWVVHTLGDLAWFAFGLAVIAGVLVWAAPRLRAAAREEAMPARSFKVPIAIAATVGVAASVLRISPGGWGRFPAEGDPWQWEWRWLGDIPDALTPHLLDDYTAAIAMLNFALFAVWGGAVAWALGRERIRWAIASVLVFPICLEALQRYPFGGTPSVRDAWTNILGGLFGVLACQVGGKVIRATLNASQTP